MDESMPQKRIKRIILDSLKVCDLPLIHNSPQWIPCLKVQYDGYFYIASLVSLTRNDKVESRHCEANRRFDEAIQKYNRLPRKFATLIFSQ